MGSIIKKYLEKSKAKNTESQITLDDQKIVFSGVDKNIVEECLEAVNNFIIYDRKNKYGLKEYAVMYLKGIILPAIIFIYMIIIVHFFH